LDDENVALTNVFPDANEGVVVGELEGFTLAQWDTEVFAYVDRQLGMGVAGEYLEFIYIKNGHCSTFRAGATHQAAGGRPANFAGETGE
jgi:hypothetical protein